VQLAHRPLLTILDGPEIDGNRSSTTAVTPQGRTPQQRGNRRRTWWPWGLRTLLVVLQLWPQSLTGQRQRTIQSTENTELCPALKPPLTIIYQHTLKVKSIWIPKNRLI